MRLFVFIALVAACDNREAFHEPDPTLARMLAQRRADPYEASSAFPNGMVMRHPPPGTIRRDDDSDAPEPAMSRALLELGHAKFDAVCAVCHGITGTGESVVATKMTLRPAPSIVNDENRGRSRQELYRIVTDGYGLMSTYSDLLAHEERWAVVAYVQALQLAQHARVAQLPESIQQRIPRNGP
ncbi:MAG TPA: cytochrome c [Labilithrix sp.]|nr:cytochrome c [Labilithrix sp.]